MGSEVSTGPPEGPTVGRVAVSSAPVDRVAEQLSALGPALAFLLAAVPLAALLDELGFFEAIAGRLHERSGEELRLAWLWALAAATTVVLNLDTTIVLLTPLYLRIGRHAGVDPVRLAVIPLVLASLASSALTVSNLTNLVVADQHGVSSGDVLRHLGAPTAAAVVVGWLVYRRSGAAIRLPVAASGVDRRALRVGGTVVTALLLAFVAGPSLGLAPWVATLVADAVLVVVLRRLPLRSIPLATAAGVAAVGALVALVVPADLMSGIVASDSVGAAAAGVAVGGTAANALNNLPALFVGLNGSGRMTAGMWGWLWGVNSAAALLPVGALANLLWRRVVRDEGHQVSWRGYVAGVAPIVLPAVTAGTVVLLIGQAIA